MIRKEKSKSILRQVILFPASVTLFILIAAISLCFFSIHILDKRSVENVMNGLHIAVNQLQNELGQIDEAFLKYWNQSDSCGYLSRIDSRKPVDMFLEYQLETVDWMNHMVGLYHLVSGAFVYYENIDLMLFRGMADQSIHEYIVNKKEGMPILLPLKPPFQNEYADWPKNFEKSLAEVVDRSDDVFAADTIRELAVNAGIEPGQLEDTVREYNEICEQKQDRQFFKKPEYLLPIRGKKFYMARYRASSFCSLGGVKIDKKASVLDTHQTAIPGLYAAGNDACSICMDTYSFFTAGLTSSFALNMGRIAAESAAEFIRALL